MLTEKPDFRHGAHQFRLDSDDLEIVGADPGAPLEADGLLDVGYKVIYNLYITYNL